MTIRVETDGRGVATLTLARAEKRNAVSSEMIAELTEAARALGEDRAVRVVVLAADGNVFSAGGDLGWMRQQMSADRDTRRAEAMRFAVMLKALNELPKPLIARVHGNAFGGGVGLISVTDAAIAVEDAVFGLTETRLGLIPATIGPYVVARLGAAAARGVMASPRLFDAQEAQRLGLITRVVSAADLDTATEAEVTPYLSAAPRAVGRTKSMVRALGPQIDAAAIAASVERLVETWEDSEAREGTSAFFEKRAPDWAV